MERAEAFQEFSSANIQRKKILRDFSGPQILSAQDLQEEWGSRAYPNVVLLERREPLHDHSRPVLESETNPKQLKSSSCLVQ